MTTKKVLEKNGWSLDCESPLEISKEGSFASGEAAEIVIDTLKKEERIDFAQYESNYLDE